MGDSITSGIFALGGALLGGLTGYAATAVEIRGRRWEATVARQDALLQTRRTLYSTLVERADLTVDAARRMWSHAESTDISPEDYDAYVAIWESLVRARASVDIIGPPAAMEAARALNRAVADVCNCVDEWINGEAWTSTAQARYSQARETWLRCRKSFVEIAHDVLSSAT